eukprot:3648228-Pyramimonas_sp.AAC.1
MYPGGRGSLTGPRDFRETWEDRGSEIASKPAPGSKSRPQEPFNRFRRRPGTGKRPLIAESAAPR